MKLKTLTIVAAAAGVALAAIAANPVLGATYPDCQGFKPPPELKGKKAIETNFVGPSGAVIIVHIGRKIVCESAEKGVPPGERGQAEHQVLTGKMHKPTIEDFSVAARPDCYDFYDACYNPGFSGPDEEACAQYEAHCR